MGPWLRGTNLLQGNDRISLIFASSARADIFDWVPTPNLHWSTVVLSFGTSGILALVFRRRIASAWNLVTARFWSSLRRRILRQLHRDRTNRSEPAYSRSEVRRIWRLLYSEEHKVIGYLNLFAMALVMDWVMAVPAPPGAFFALVSALKKHVWGYALYTFAVSLVRPVLGWVLARQYRLEGRWTIALGLWLPVVGSFTPLLKLLNVKPLLANYLLNTPMRQALAALWRLAGKHFRHERAVVRIVEICVVNPAYVLLQLSWMATLGYLGDEMGLLSRWWTWIPAVTTYLGFVLGELRMERRSRNSDQGRNRRGPPPAGTVGPSERPNTGGTTGQSTRFLFESV